MPIVWPPIRSTSASSAWTEERKNYDDRTDEQGRKKVSCGPSDGTATAAAAVVDGSACPRARPLLPSPLRPSVRSFRLSIQREGRGWPRLGEGGEGGSFGPTSVAMSLRLTEKLASLPNFAPDLWVYRGNLPNLVSVFNHQKRTLNC